MTARNMRAVWVVPGAITDPHGSADFQSGSLSPDINSTLVFEIWEAKQ
jgi:hypothetical protein